MVISNNDDRLHRSLGMAYAGLGRRSDAISEGQFALSLLPPEREAFSGPYNLEGLAIIYAQLVEAGPAVETLRELLSIPGPSSIQIVILDPRYDLIRETPEYQRLVDDYVN